MDSQTLNDYQLIKMISNDVIGDVKILRSQNSFFLAKKLDNYQIEVLRNKSNVFEHLSRNSDHIQKCHGQFMINSEAHLIFDYYDYTLNDLFVSNTNNEVFLAEDSILKLIKVGIDTLSSLFKSTCYYHPYIDMKTINISNQGDIKISNPLLFNEFIGLRHLDHQSYKNKFYSTIDKIGIIGLELASLKRVTDANGNVELDRLENSFKIVRKKYSIILLNVLKMFGYNLIHERDDRFFNFLDVNPAILTPGGAPVYQNNQVNSFSTSKRKIKIFDENSQKGPYSRVSNLNERVEYIPSTNYVDVKNQEQRPVEVTNTIFRDYNSNYIIKGTGNQDEFQDINFQKQTILKNSSNSAVGGLGSSNKIKSLLFNNSEGDQYDVPQHYTNGDNQRFNSDVISSHIMNNRENQNAVYTKNKVIEEGDGFFSMYDSNQFNQRDVDMKSTLKYQEDRRTQKTIPYPDENLKESYFVSRNTNQPGRQFENGAKNYVENSYQSQRYGNI